MLVKLLLVLLPSYALNELDPINDLESHDEVAQAQERSVWIACLYLAYSHIDKTTEKISALQAQTQFALPQIKRKISATILERCSSSITWKEAEDIISGTVDDKYLQFLEVDFNNFDIGLNSAQTELVSKIEKFVNEKPEDYYQPPPKTQGTELENSEFNYWWLGLLGLIPVVWVLRPKPNPKPKVQKPEEKRKKKH